MRMVLRRPHRARARHRPRKRTRPPRLLLHPLPPALPQPLPPRGQVHAQERVLREEVPQQGGRGEGAAYACEEGEGGRAGVVSRFPFLFAVFWLLRLGRFGVGVGGSGRRGASGEPYDSGWRMTMPSA